MNQQALVYIRGEVVDAMFPHVRTRGQLEFDESVITVRHIRRRRKDPETSALIDSDPVRGYTSQSYKTSSCPLPFNAFFHSKITRSINMLPEHQKSLALFAYKEECEWCHVEVVSRWLWGEFLGSQSTAFREKKKGQLKSMVLLAMQNWQGLMITGSDVHEPAKVRELLGVSESNWRRDWLPFWRQFHDILTAADEEVLTHVLRETDKARRDTRNAQTA